MTFSLLARDEDGSFGAAIASSSPAVGARCLWLRDKVGAVATQNITDPRIGNRCLDMLAAGMKAVDVLSQLELDDPNARFRQVLVIDAQGTSSLRSGSESLGTVGSAFGNGVIAAGNLLASDQVPRAMVTAFERERGPLEIRLLSALRAAVIAGAEAGPIHSAGIAVVTDVGWRVTDLRVDWHDDPVEELARVLSVWLPQRAAYITRAIDPSLSLGYGVPGDDRH
jgi:uncharacterized Ntn-hydrolase superfamily protein